MSITEPIAGLHTAHTITAFSEPLAEHLLVRFIQDEIQKVGMKRAVLGLSGGIDSALVAFLAAQALGTENVLCVLMPYKTSSRDSLTDARLMVDPYFEKLPDASGLRRGNVMARTRMITLYDMSMARGGLVLGTSNKTELLLGYGTIFGDLASAINPIGDLYKTEVRAVSRYS